MKIIAIKSLPSICVLFLLAANSHAANPLLPDYFAANYANSPISFEANIGQANAAVQFLAHGPNGSLFLMPTEARLALHNSSKNRQAIGPTDVISLKLSGANANPTLEPLDQLPGTANY